MRELLSDLMVATALKNSNTIILSGDHGYALFDKIRSVSPNQFLNVGIMEQAMVGIAAGLSKAGQSPIVYGLSAFVPVRVLEQIKLDICYSNLPVVFLGDGAGLVYSTLGSSHQCAEDIACLRPLPNLRIYAPADKFELEDCFTEAIDGTAPAYIRIGKSDRPVVSAQARGSTAPYFTYEADANTCIVSTSSMTSIAHDIARENKISNYSVQRIKPVHNQVVADLRKFKRLLVIEEHSRFGGLTSTLTDTFCESQTQLPLVSAFTLKEHFSEKCGSYQYALSEHGMSDEQLHARVKDILHPK